MSSNFVLKPTFPFLVFWAVLLAVDPAYAQDLRPITSVADTLLKFATGSFAVAFASLAVAGVGYSYFTGRIGWESALTVMIGIALVFGAPRIVQVLSAAAKGVG